MKWLDCCVVLFGGGLDANANYELGVVVCARVLFDLIGFWAKIVANP